MSRAERKEKRKKRKKKQMYPTNKGLVLSFQFYCGFQLVNTTSFCGDVVILLCGSCGQSAAKRD